MFVPDKLNQPIEITEQSHALGQQKAPLLRRSAFAAGDAGR